MERKKSESRAVWAKRIERLRSSDLTFAEFAAETGVNLHSLKKWKYVFDREARGEPWPPARNKIPSGRRRQPGGAAKKPRAERRPRFIEIAMPLSADIRIEVIGATLHLPAGFDDDALRRALRVLREAA